MTGPSLVTERKAPPVPVPVLTETRESRILPSPVLVEVDHLLRRYTRTDSFVAVLDQLQRVALVIEDLTAADYSGWRSC